VATRTGLGVTPSPERAVIFQFALAVLVLRLLSDLRQDLVQLFSMDLEDVCHAADRGGVCPAASSRSSTLLIRILIAVSSADEPCQYAYQSRRLDSM
jgi:hypothetical protein